MGVPLVFLVIASVLVVGAVGFGLLAFGMNAHVPNTRPNAKTVVLSSAGCAVIAAAFTLAAVLI